jgi:hypothetical protein
VNPSSSSDLKAKAVVRGGEEDVGDYSDDDGDEDDDDEEM